MAIDFTITKRVRVGTRTKPRPISAIDFAHLRSGSTKNNRCGLCKHGRVLKGDILCKKCKEQAV